MQAIHGTAKALPEGRLERLTVNTHWGVAYQVVFVQTGGSVVKVPGHACSSTVGVNEILALT